MKVTKIRDDVWKFKGNCSVYLVRSGEHNILIDAGDEGDREDLRREVSKVVDLDRVDVILMTHFHFDHVAGFDLFPNAEIFASKEEIEDYKEDAKGFHFYVSDVSDKILLEKAKPFPEESVDGEFFGLKVLKVPGHTRGSVAFLDEGRKLLFSGDTIFGGGIQGRVDLPNSVPDKMGDSTKFLRKLVADKGLGLCPGHGYWEESL